MLLFYLGFFGELVGQFEAVFSLLYRVRDIQHAAAHARVALRLVEAYPQLGRHAEPELLVVHAVEQNLELILVSQVAAAQNWLTEQKPKTGAYLSSFCMFCENSKTF